MVLPSKAWFCLGGPHSPLACSLPACLPHASEAFACDLCVLHVRADYFCELNVVQTVRALLEQCPHFWVRRVGMAWACLSTCMGLKAGCSSVWHTNGMEAP